jgi:hypothetical protein
MDSRDYLFNEIGGKISMRLFNQLYVLTREYPTKDEIHKITAEVLLKRKGIGKVGVNEFYKVVLNKKPPFKLISNINLIDEDKVYNNIETAIIRWNIDGTKTAGDLTREIIAIFKEQENGRIK